MTCACCKSVNTICFWGPRREASWKRPVLMACSVVLVLGFGALAWYATSRPEALSFVVLASLVAIMGVLGLVIALTSCNACVARVLGEV
jgi:apolipoprotein N-acyltransferase